MARPTLAMQTSNTEDQLTVIALLRLSAEVEDEFPVVARRAYWLAKGIREEL
jgi:hypothetical protein